VCDSSAIDDAHVWIEVNIMSAGCALIDNKTTLRLDRCKRVRVITAYVNLSSAVAVCVAVCSGRRYASMHYDISIVRR